MRKEKSAGAIVLRFEQGIPQYLLLHSPSSARAKKDFWYFPKGRIEQGESETQAALREIAEETGLSDVDLVPGFQEESHYYFQAEGDKISKTVVFFIGVTKEKDVRISSEHSGFIWLPYEKARKTIRFPTARDVLDKARDFLLKTKREA